MPVALVTGGAGFLGSHVADWVLKSGTDVVVLDDLSGGAVANVPAGAEFVEGSITDAALVERLFRDHGFTYVYHLAAYAAEGLSHFIRCFNYTNNVVGSMVLIDAAVNHNVKCLVFTSSIAVYGAAQAPMTEETTPAPEDPYGIAKWTVEQDLAAARRLFGLPYVIFRPHNVYGERQNVGDRYRNVVGIFMNQIMQGLPCTVFGDGNQRRAFTHVDDVAPIIARAPGVPETIGQVFNIGADRDYSVNELAEAVQAAMGQHTGIAHLPARHEVVNAFSDHSALRRVFGTEPKVTLTAGLEKMAAWAKGRGAQPTGVFRNIEIRRELPPSWASVVAFED
jgi:UDP-glucose 4-epimerase